LSKSNVEYATEFYLDVSDKTPVNILHVDDEVVIRAIVNKGSLSDTEIYIKRSEQYSEGFCA